jgi:hypothetical protein
MQLMIGLDNFGQAVTQKIGFIDKSLFIKEILDNEPVVASVITRPRRFGKTFNLSMLRHFLTPEVIGIPTKDMFKDLKIAQAGSAYMDHQGKYPVIFVTFKSIDDSNFESAYEKIQLLISDVYEQHQYLLDSPKLSEHDKKIYKIILETDAGNNPSLITESLKKLTRFLHLHHGIKPWLLIDEYDTPIQAGYLNKHYDQIVEFMRGMFGSALKGNDYLHRAVITGILRVSKESLFSGVNNLKVYSLLNFEYANCFGFTQSEVDEALKKANLEHLSKDIKSWYNGYTIGDHQIYNPWSIANYIYAKGAVAPYWVNISGSGLIRTSMAAASTEIKEQFELILAGKPIKAMITENMVFSDLTNNSDALWSLLLFSGYLTVIEKNYVGTDLDCLLRTPNYEVHALYKTIINNWFSAPLGQISYQNFLKSLTTGDLNKFIKTLKQFLKESLSHFDVKGHHPEKFYHGFVLGLMVGLSETHIVESNKESGDGRYDVMIIPKDLTKLGLIAAIPAALKKCPITAN